MPHPTPTRCRGPRCGQSIVFVECHRRDGTVSKPMPVNELPVQDDVDVEDPRALRGLLVYEGGGRVRHAQVGDQGPFFRAHHATCKDADLFRGRRERRPSK